MGKKSETKNNKDSEFVKKIFCDLIKKIQEKHGDEGQTIAMASGAFKALREFCPNCTLTVAEISELLDAMLS